MAKLKTKIGWTVVVAAVYWIVLNWLVGCHRVVVETPEVNDTVLKQDYLDYNYGYFGNRLPKDTIVMLGPAYAYGRENLGLTVHWNEYIIEINPKYHLTQKQADITLLHEMCHVANWGKYHSPEWQACMLDLAEQGAFSDLW
jgi:hypothetical protein